MNGNHVRIIMGFSMLCCVNVICFFPDALAPWASTEWLRTYNMYARPAECLSLVAIAVFAFKVPRRIGMVGVAIGYVGLLCGLCAPAILGSNVETSVLAGILCGMGLAPTMMFWFAFLTEFTERHQAIVQGWQALVGECLFLGVSIFFDAGVVPACILTATSAICALRVDSSSLFSESGGAGSSAKSFLSLGKTEWLAPCAGYLIASLAYGALIALSRGAEGEAASEVVSAIGAPIGALCFIAWAVTSRRRDYGAVSEWVVAASAVACLLSGSATVLLFSAFFQITGLLLFSLFIDRLSAMPRAAIACIASAYAISHLLFSSASISPAHSGLQAATALPYENWHGSPAQSARRPSSLERGEQTPPALSLKTAVAPTNASSKSSKAKSKNTTKRVPCYELRRSTATPSESTISPVSLLQKNTD